MDLTTFLPHLAGMHLEHLLATDAAITLTVAATARVAACPLCKELSDRVQSRYQRAAADRPWGHRPVRLIIRVRRFWRRNAACPRRVFAERFPALVAPYAQRTAPQLADLRELGLALGGRAGARLAGRLGVAISHDTVLRLAATAPIPAVAAPRVVGIDDFSFRRGRSFGTLIVDLERHRPIALLPDRAASTVAAWLAAWPAIAVVVRDRYDGYAAGATAGAPAALQVVDRFHIVKNLGDALEHFLLTKTTCLRQVTLEGEGHAAPAAEAAQLTPPAQLESPPWRQRQAEASRQRHAHRVEQYHHIHQLCERGVDIAQIARAIGVSRETVYRYLRQPEPPQPKCPTGRRARSVLAPYVAYLLQRWEEGCTNATRLWREIRARGYPGSSSPVAKLARQWRLQQRAGRRPTPLPRAKKTLTVRQAVRLFLKRPEALTEVQRRALDRLYELDEVVAAAYRLTQEFAALVRERRGEALDEWVERARQCGSRDLGRFALGLQDDPAVRAGLVKPWSNGQTEGQITRLKYLKRQGYGRAGYALLRTRVLVAA
ncbi:MAG: ISL3 family transposase [Chloroflexi bacterium]|nr:ISL3 family transposase [Chloroflexota bacterium]